MTDPTPATPPATLAKQPNPLGLAALIVGVVGFLFAVIPFLSFIAWLPALVAIGLGIAGLVARNRKRPLALVGLLLGILAIIVGIIVSLASIAGVASSVGDQIEEDEQEASELVTLTYEVTSDAGTVSNITWSTYTDDEEGTQQATDADVPWTESIEIERGGDFDFNIFSLTVQAAQDADEVTCKITLDGEVISENTSTGAFAVASCSGSSSDLDG